MYKNLRFYLGQNGPLKQYHSVESWYFPLEFLDKNVLEYDYAVLKLGMKSSRKEFIPLKVDLFGVGEKDKVVVYGYSGDELQSKHPLDKYKMELHQWGLIEGHHKI